MGSDKLTVKILDFGIAKLVSGNNEGTQHKTRTGSLLGTPAYMSPEQCRDASTIDHRADVYALGCIFFEMVAGRPPFVRQGSGEIIVAHVVEPPPRLSSVVPDVSPTLEALVAQMLEKDPSARPQSMVEISERLTTMPMGRPVNPLNPLMISTAIMGYSVDGPVAQPSHGGVAPSPLPGRPVTPAPGATSPVVPTPVPASTSTRSGSGLNRVPVRVPPASSGPVMAGGTRVMPAGNYTTMSDSAAEVAEQVELPAGTRRRPTAIIAAAGGAVAIAVIAILLLKGGGKPAAPEAPPSPPVVAAPVPPTPPPAPTPPPTPPSTDVTLEVQSDPPDAEVWLTTDKAARGKTPFRMTVDKNGGATHLILKARGYADKALDLDPTAASPVVVTLEKAAGGHDRDRDRGREKVATTPERDQHPRDTLKGSGKSSGRSSSKDSYKAMGD